MKKATIRVESKKYLDRDRAHDKMRREFRDAREEYGIEKLMKEKQFFTRNSDKKRKKKQMKVLAARLNLREKEREEENKRYY